MSINFSHTNGVSNWIHEKKVKMFEGISQSYPRESFGASQIQDPRLEWGEQPLAVKKLGTKWTYLSGFPKGLYCAMLSLVARIVAVGEPIVKGLGNLFAAPFSKKCHVVTGLKQLGVELPKSILKLVLLTPVEVAADALVTPLAVMLDKDYAMARAAFEFHLIDKKHPIPVAVSLNSSSAHSFNDFESDLEEDA